MTANKHEWIDKVVACFGVIYPESRSRYPVTRSDILTIERDVGGLIGEDLTYFLSRYGDSMLGDDDARACISVDPADCLDDVVCPSDFFSASLRSENSLTKIYRIARTPAGLLPIAADASANLICVDITQGHGEVFYLFRKMITSSWSTAKIAPSFAAFLESLKRVAYQVNYD